MKKKTRSFLAVSVVLVALLAGFVPFAAAAELPGLLCHEPAFADQEIVSRLQGNALNDPPVRTGRLCVPEDFYQSTEHYPLLVGIAGMEMKSVENTMDTIMEVREDRLGEINPSYPAKFGDYRIDVDGILRQVMTKTGQKFVYLELSPITSNGSGWGLASEVGGDQIGWIRAVVDKVRNDPNNRILPGRNNLMIYGFSTGAYAAFIQAVTQRDTDGKAYYGALAMNSPAGTNYAAPGPPDTNFIRAHLWKYVFPIRTPMNDVPVTREMTRKEAEEGWGTIAGFGSKFWATAWRSVDAIALFNASSPWGPTWPWADSFLTDEFNPVTAGFVLSQFNKVATYDIRTALFVHGAGANLAQTPTITTRGNDRDAESGGATEIPLHSEVPDGFLAPIFLNQVGVANTYVQTRGDHFTNMAYPGLPGNLETAVTFLLAKRGTQDGATLNWNDSLAQRYAPIQAQFPHYGGW